MTTGHRYSIEPHQPAAHLFRLTITVEEPDPAGQAFTMPAWVPGSYMIRDFARNIVSVRAESDGQEIELVKTDKSTWLAGPCDRPLTLLADISAVDPSVRGAYLDTNRGFFDGAAVFPAVVGQEDRECRLEIQPPPDSHGSTWRVATTMKPENTETYAFGTYVAADYAELIDHPVEIGNFHVGEFEAGGIPHAIAVTGHARFDMARVCHDLARLCEAQLSFLGRPADFDRYLFLLTVTEGGYGGLEHRWSSSLICSRSDLPKRNDPAVSDDYRKFLGLCSHEYFHLWNVKRMKPEGFTPYDLATESHTGLLWVFEGITSYYDDLFLARAGLISHESYLELLGKTITRVLRTGGRRRQSVEEASFDAWTKFYKRDVNSPNTTVSYYAKGSLVALALDLTIRKETAGNHSLDDVVSAAWQRFGESGLGMPERGIESIAREVTGLELADFFERYVRGTIDIPLQGLFRTVGLRMCLRSSSGSADSGGNPAKDDSALPTWLGASLDRQGSANRFTIVHSGSPAELAGISPGDEAVAFDDLRLTAENMDKRLRDYHVGDRVSVTVFRDHKLLRLKVKLAEPPEDTCYLVVDDDAGEAAGRERDSWLGKSDDA